MLQIKFIRPLFGNQLVISLIVVHHHQLKGVSRVEGGEGKAVVAQLRRRVCAKWLLACILHSWLGGSHVVVCVASECVVRQVYTCVCARVCAWHR